ncbi:ATP-binding protein [Sansalvadorimonas sp. 2012CJ34-2]|uniref:ATP-binding protein n=1 Tax=Parendozoicomonas callyspongiae TaxID=2942213 RepID=A0ABT0PEL1_9GAMM|nr:ATP-binding protein [Sansalvadorimonas sp. 2012CJ34-2]MCL6269810.1 ATP-binding protein [Sansalvadorimonas sp. 2012CJ34-2]
MSSVLQGQSEDIKPQCITLCIDSQLEDTVLVAMAVRGVCGMTSLTAEEINRVELCVVEVVNNAIEHAYQGRPNETVEVDVMLNPTRSLEIVVRDCGTPMSKPLSADAEMSVPDPTNPETWLSSGRGIPIVERLMDEIRYESCEDGNAFHMIRQLG